MAIESSNLRFLCSDQANYILMVQPPLTQEEAEAFVTTDITGGRDDMVEIAGDHAGTVLRIAFEKEGNRTLPQVAEHISSVLASSRPAIEVDLKGGANQPLHELRTNYPDFVDQRCGIRTKPTYRQLGKPIPGAHLSPEAQANLDRSFDEIDRAQRTALVTGDTYLIGLRHS